MFKQILVLLVGLIISSEASIATESESVVGTLNQALGQALWEIETKRLAVENQQRALDALIAKVEKLDKSVKESEKGFGELVSQVAWGSSITTNILEIVLIISAVAFAGGFYGVYQGVYRWLRASVKKEHKRLTSELEEYFVRITQEAKYKLSASIYFQLTTEYYTSYRKFIGFEHREEFKNAALIAKNFSEKALQSINAIRDDDPDKRSLLFKAEHANFYHKASMRDISQADAAIDYATNKLPAIIEEFKRNNKADWYYAKETRCWILVRLGNAEQQEQGKAEVKQLLDDGDIPSETRAEIRQNYDNIGISFALRNKKNPSIR